eukprot:SM000305S11805  [mRNA]  locus=s305:13160:15418:+ [translate_table: standard]
MDFLNITDRVFYDRNEAGFLGIAFHPQFLTNGRWFVYYICNSTAWPDFQGPCGCDPALGCYFNDSRVAAAYQPHCTTNTVVAEYWAGAHPATANASLPTEVRRIWTYGRPYNTHMGGHIYFNRKNPTGDMFITSGDGGGEGDIYNFAQNGLSLLGKILRVNVNNITTSNAQWNYRIPPDNPFVHRTDVNVRPEVWALGFRNPWSCTIDKENDDFFCADVGQDTEEELNLIVPGGNYGWRLFEGTVNFTQVGSLKRYPPVGGITAPDKAINHPVLSPLIEYAHRDFNPASSSIIQGPIYRGPLSCYYGKMFWNECFNCVNMMQVATDTTPPGVGKAVAERVVAAGVAVLLVHEPFNMRSRHQYGASIWPAHKAVVAMDLGGGQQQRRIHC